MSHIFLNKSASVVELDVAREILWTLGYSARREEERLYVFERDRGPFYSNDPLPSHVDSLYVDEGTFTDCMTKEGRLLASCNPWSELVDYCELLSIVFTNLLPLRDHPQSDAIGHGRNKRNRINEYHKALESHERIIWVSEIK